MQNYVKFNKLGATKMYYLVATDVNFEGLTEVSFRIVVWVGTSVSENLAASTLETERKWGKHVARLNRQVTGIHGKGRRYTAWSQQER
jgi:hypothetical protein